MKGWAAYSLGSRQTRLQVALAAVLLSVLLWALPTRRAGEDGGRHAAHAPVLDLFEKAGVTELKEGQRGPAFRLERIDGGWATRETWKDRVVVLNFWATWCTPCTTEMPTLETLWREYRDRGLVVVGVSVDRGAPRPLIDPYVRSLQLTFPILLDPEETAAKAWRVTGLPATFVIRPGGEVAGMAFGPREWNSGPMKALLETLNSNLGGPEMAPQTPQRSGRPGKPVAPLDPGKPVAPLDPGKPVAPLDPGKPVAPLDRPPGS